jgi:hypothetical protein
MTPGEQAPQTKTLEQIEIENKLPEMQDILNYLRNTKPRDDNELEEYEERLLSLIGWTDRAFIFDNSNHTEIENLLGNPKELKNEIEMFHKKITDLEMGR